MRSHCIAPNEKTQTQLAAESKPKGSPNPVKLSWKKCSVLKFRSPFGICFNSHLDLCFLSKGLLQCLPVQVFYYYCCTKVKRRDQDNVIWLKTNIYRRAKREEGFFVFASSGLIQRGELKTSFYRLITVL